MIQVFWYYWKAKHLGSRYAEVRLEELTFSQDENISTAAKMCLVKLGLKPEDWDGEV